MRKRLHAHIFRCNFPRLPRGAFFVMPGVSGAAPSYSGDPVQWTELTPPPLSQKEKRAEWFRAAGRSRFDWRVSGGVVRTGVGPDVGASGWGRGPEFTPRAEGFTGATSFMPVPDGWLAAFNEGDPGAALYWFSKDGGDSYKISDHHVTGFFLAEGGVHAVEGLTQMGVSNGSVIRVSRDRTAGKWEAEEVLKLPSAPRAVAYSFFDRSVYITLDDALIATGPGWGIRTVPADPPWAAGLCPNSSAATIDGRWLYIGMRQFVGDYNLETGKMRLLVPSGDFMAKALKGSAE